MYIVIEVFDPYYPMIVSDPETGNPKIFYSEELAEKEADDCQDAIVVEY
jgi:hypothetical protein